MSQIVQLKPVNDKKFLMSLLLGRFAKGWTDEKPTVHVLPSLVKQPH